MQNNPPVRKELLSGLERDRSGAPYANNADADPVLVDPDLPGQILSGQHSDPNTPNPTQFKSHPMVDAANPAGAPAIADPRATQVQEEERRRRGGMRVTDTGHAYRLGAQDFNPAGYRPNESRSTSVGKYGGAPLYANALAWPDAVFASARTKISEKRDALKKAYEQFDPMAGVEDVNAPEYRDQFSRAAMDSIHQFQASVLDQYGDEMGRQRMMTPGTNEYNELRKLGSHWTTIARLTNQSTASADQIIKGYGDGTLQVPQELYQRALDLRHDLKEGVGNDPEKLAKKMEVFHGNVSLVDQLAKDKTIELLNDAGTRRKFYETVRRGDDLHDPRFRTLRGKETITYDDAVDALADAYAPQYNGLLSRDEVKRTIRSLVRDTDVEDVKMDEYSTGGSGGGGAKNSGLYTVDKTALPSTLGAPTDAAGDKAQYKPNYYPTINLLNIVSDQGRTSQPMEYRDGNKTVYMHPQRLMNVDGDLMVVGKLTGMTKASIMKMAEDKKGTLTEADFAEIMNATGDIESDESQAVFQKFNLLEDVMVPVYNKKGEPQNAGLLESSFGLNINEAEKALGIDEKKYENGYRRQDGAVYSAKHGGFYKKQGDKYVRVN